MPPSISKIFSHLLPPGGRAAQHKGQGLVEFALAIPVFLLVALGIIEFGYLMFTYSSVFSASREAARYGASVGTNVAGVPHELDCAGIRAAAVRIGGIVGVTTSTVSIRYDKGPTDIRPWDSLPSCESQPVTQLGDRILVRINFTFKSLVGVIPSLPISNTDARSIIKSVDVSGNFPTAIPIIYTPTKSRTPLPPGFPTATLTPTPVTPTATPVLDTPTITPTVPSPTPTPDRCLELGWSGVGWDPYSSKYFFNLENLSSTDTATLRSMVVSWSIAGGSYQYITSASFGGSLLWGGMSTSPFMVGDSASGYPSLWNSGAGVTVGPNSSSPMTLIFTGPITMRLVSLSVQLGSDPSFVCTITPAVAN